jgi:tRNA-dihydrouridine synthase A
MREPELVADCVAAMKASVRIPVTVKMRIGVVEGRKRETAAAIAQVSEEDVAGLHRFTKLIRDAGCEVAIVHARKAVLGGLSPKENRQVPPLRYDIVRDLRRAFPSLPMIVNGGFRTVDESLAALDWCDGVMLGREAYHRPYVLAQLDAVLYGNKEEPLVPRETLLDRMARYAGREMAKGERLSSITRHMLGLYSGEPGAREYRRVLSEGARAPHADPELIRAAAPGVI